MKIIKIRYYISLLRIFILFRTYKIIEAVMIIMKKDEITGRIN